MTSAQVGAIPTFQVTGLSTLQLSRLGADEVAGLSTPQIVAM